MKNVEMTLEGSTLIVRIDITKELGPSSSGKSEIVASTEGNASVPGHEDIKVGVNVFKPRKRRKEGVQ